MRVELIPFKAIKTARKRAPWAVAFIPEPGGWLAFESKIEYRRERNKRRYNARRATTRQKEIIADLLQRKGMSMSDNGGVMSCAEAADVIQKLQKDLGIFPNERIKKRMPMKKSYQRGATTFFSYLERQRGITITLGKYIAQNVIKSDRYAERLRTPEEINDLDRMQLAKKFCRSVSSIYLEGAPSREIMLHDIARYIDKQIPYAYYRLSGYKHARADRRLVDAAAAGLRYHYEQ